MGEKYIYVFKITLENNISSKFTIQEIAKI